MAVQSFPINTHGQLTSPPPHPGDPASSDPYQDSGSGEALGGGVFLTAAHLFVQNYNGGLYEASSEDVAGTPINPNIPLSSPVYIGNQRYDPNNPLQYDLAITTAPSLSNTSNGTLSPIVTFADQMEATAFFSRNYQISFRAMVLETETRAHSIV